MLPHLTNGTGVPLLALHGNFASSAWWRDLVRDPPPGVRVVAPDLPGFAGTSAPVAITIPALADAVEAFARQAKLERPVLLGHSLGGAVALELATRDPSAYRGLVLAASAPLSGLKTPEENYPLLELMRTTPALVEASFRSLFPSRLPGDFEEFVRDAARLDARGYSGFARALESWRVPERPLGLPTMVLGGMLDALATPDMVRALAASLGVEAVLLEGRGHGFPQEDPAWFRARLAAFVQDIKRDVPARTA